MLRLVLRPLDRSLTAEQANQLRDQVYATIHEGPNWSGRPDNTTLMTIHPPERKRSVLPANKTIRSRSAALYAMSSPRGLQRSCRELRVHTEIP